MWAWQEPSPRHVTRLPYNPVMKLEPIPGDQLIIRRCTGSVGLPPFHDTVNHRFNRRVTALGSDDRIRNSRIEIFPCKSGCQQEHAQAALCARPSRKGGPVEIRV